MSFDQDKTITRADAALAMVILAADKKKLLFQKAGTRVPASEIMKFESIIQDLLKISTFCVNMHAELNFRTRGSRKNAPGEDVLLAAGMDYALDIIPRASGGGSEEEDVVDIDTLKEFVESIERAFGRIVIDMTFSEDIKLSHGLWRHHQALGPSAPLHGGGQ